MAKVTATNVLLYYPNIIGYLRVVFMILAFYYASSTGRSDNMEWKASMICYGLAFFGDVVDGYVARAFHQCSEFGGVLDMVTDRVSTAGLLAMLTNLYPTYSFAFVMLIVLDIGSHWFHVMSVTGHHKAKETLQKRDVRRGEAWVNAHCNFIYLNSFSFS